MNDVTNTHIQSSGMDHDHATRDAAMSCLGYHSGAHGANHFETAGGHGVQGDPATGGKRCLGLHETPAGQVVTGLVISERLAELLDEGANGANVQAIQEHLGNTVSLLQTSVDRILASHGPCPQGLNCFGDAKPRRLHTCPMCDCDFRGCAPCVEAHEELAHKEALISEAH